VERKGSKEKTKAKERQRKDKKKVKKRQRKGGEKVNIECLNQTFD
jgi:hypothetical protein